MKEAAVKSAGKTSAIGIKKRRHKPARRPPGRHPCRVSPAFSVDTQGEQADIGDRHLENQPFLRESEGKMMNTAFALFLVLAVALIGIAPSVSLAENPSN